jgi:hypothetical protein
MIVQPSRVTPSALPDYDNNFKNLSFPHLVGVLERGYHYYHNTIIHYHQYRYSKPRALASSKVEAL